ncbi:hypothetical protein INT45_002646 [Circinella minor]|uniref:Uncharacterized protein n=1 Tax=Circinella minor TaxID=1195481 RepID=A0A8H7RQS8_9FUNG|nr:hypothetical protein INT45_002646 [Circinella minor]
MSNNFFYKDGQGKIVDEEGNEAMDIEEDIDPYNLGTLMTLTQYHSFRDRFPTEPTEELDTRMEEASEELVTETAKGRKYTVYTDKHKAVFWYFNRVKLWKAAPAAHKAQTNKVNQKQQQLQEEHKQHLIEFFDEYPQATRQNAVDSLMESFQNFNLKTTSVRNFILHEYNLTVKRVTLHSLSRNSSHNLEKRYDWVKKYINTDMNYLQNCVFVDETGFNINMRQPYARSISGTPAIVETPTTRAI